MSRKTAMAAALAVVTLAFGASFAAAGSKSGSIKGAGSTFVFPLVSQWQANYKNAQITYGSVGPSSPEPPWRQPSAPPNHSDGRPGDHRELLAPS